MKKLIIYFLLGFVLPTCMLAQTTYTVGTTVTADFPTLWDAFDFINSANTNGNITLQLNIQVIIHQILLKQIKLSDVIVDQFILGWYGMFSLEAMCMRKPVLCYIREDLAEKYKNLPILNTKPE